MKELRYIWLLYLAITVVCGSVSKLRRLKVTKKVTHGNNTKKVSSDKAHNGGRKGPMSGGSGSLPSPILIPFPIIPATPTDSKTALKNGQRKKKENRQKTSRNKSERKHHSKNTRNRILNNVKEENSVPVQVNKHLLQLHKQEDATTDIPISNITLERLRRGTRTDELTDEEIFLRDKWVHPEEKDLIPGVEFDFYIPEDLKFIQESQRDLERHIREIIPPMEKYRQNIRESKNNVQFERMQHRQTREVDGRSN